MGKGFVVVDMPDKCKVCRFYYPARDMNTGQYASGCRMIPTMMIREPEKKPNWCPIQFPKRKPGTEKYQNDFEKGWNACINEHLKE